MMDKYIEQAEMFDAALSRRDMQTIGRMMEELAELARRLAERDAEVERLAAIVERLPKTADGVPVAPHDIVYALLLADRWTRAGYRIVACDTAAWDTRSPQAVFQGVPDGNRPGQCEVVHFDIEHCYSTREAAQRAASAGGEVG